MRIKGDSTPSYGVVQSASKCCRLCAHFMNDEFDWLGPLSHLLLR